MGVKKDGPRNIGIFHLVRYRFPLTAIASILHRVSGVLLFMLIPVLLWALDQSLLSAERFQYVMAFFHAPVLRFILWVGLSALLYHLMAGVKHLFMDFGCFEYLHSATLASVIVIGVSVMGMITLGVVLW